MVKIEENHVAFLSDCPGQMNDVSVARLADQTASFMRSAVYAGRIEVRCVLGAAQIAQRIKADLPPDYTICFFAMDCNNGSHWAKTTGQS